MIHRLVHAARCAVVAVALAAVAAVAVAVETPSGDPGASVPVDADAAVAADPADGPNAFSDPAAPAEGAESPDADGLSISAEALVPAAPIVAAPDLVVQAWRAAPATPHARTAALRRLRLEYGLGDLRAPAQVVLAATDPDDPETGTALARELAPRMPGLGWVHVQDLWRAGAYAEAVRALVNVCVEATRDFEAQLWLVGNGLFLAWLVVLVSTGAFVVLLAGRSFARAAHDLADPLSTAMPAFARATLLAALLLTPLVVGEGLTGVLLVAFLVAFVYAAPLERSALVLSAIGWTLALHPLAHWTSVAVDALDLDPVARSAFAVIRGTETRADVDRLAARPADDLAAGLALVQRARRFGDDARAVASLDALAVAHPTDPVVLADRANVAMRAGRIEEAIGLYERAISQSSSPTLLFDLSQAYSTVLRMEEAELALVRAQQVGDSEVAALSSLSDPRLVADLGYPTATLRERLDSIPFERTPAIELVRILAPGRLGANVKATGAAFGVAVLVGMLLASRFDRSSSCHRCGHRICTRCDETVWSDDLCEDCHHLFKNPDATDPKLRSARLAVLAHRELWRSRAIALASLLIPGVAGLAARRPDVSLLSLALFTWGAAWLAWPAGPLADSTWLGGLAAALLGAAGVLALGTYAVTVAGCFLARRAR